MSKCADSLRTPPHRIQAFASLTFMGAVMTKSHWQPLTIVAAFLLGVCVGPSWLGAQDAAAPGNPQERNLDAILFVQTSAEYHACCLQAYQVATDQLLARLKEQRHAKPAVVLDLDETIFDNTRFQTYLYRERLPYSDAVWESFERDQADEVSLLPGAKTFLQLCQREQVTIVLISNRSANHLASAQSIFTRHGLDLAGTDWLLRTGGGDKTERRRLASSKYQVLLFLGDNLRDFDERFRVPRADEGSLEDLTVFARVQAERRQQVEADGPKWGREWIIFPNPIYGEWGKLVERRPGEKLRPSAMRRQER